MSFLNIDPPKVRQTVQIPAPMMDEVNELLAFFQHEQPKATLDHLVEAALGAYLNKNTKHMKAFFAWKQAQDASPQSKAAPPALKAPQDQAKELPDRTKELLARAKKETPPSEMDS